ncbi:hypothetical protein KIPB_001094, partial [Kipferlia bialata]
AEPPAPPATMPALLKGNARIAKVYQKPLDWAKYMLTAGGRESGGEAEREGGMGGVARALHWALSGVWGLHPDGRGKAYTPEKVVLNPVLCVGQGGEAAVMLDLVSCPCSIGCMEGREYDDSDGIVTTLMTKTADPRAHFVCSCLLFLVDTCNALRYMTKLELDTDRKARESGEGERERPMARIPPVLEACLAVCPRVTELVLTFMQQWQDAAASPTPSPTPSLPNVGIDPNTAALVNRAMILAGLAGLSLSALDLSRPEREAEDFSRMTHTMQLTLADMVGPVPAPPVVQESEGPFSPVKGNPSNPFAPFSPSASLRHSRSVPTHPTHLSGTSTGTHGASSLRASALTLTPAASAPSIPSASACVAATPSTYTPMPLPDLSLPMSGMPFDVCTAHVGLSRGESLSLSAPRDGPNAKPAVGESAIILPFAGLRTSTYGHAMLRSALALLALPCVASAPGVLAGTANSMGHEVAGAAPSGVSDSDPSSTQGAAVRLCAGALCLVRQGKLSAEPLSILFRRLIPYARETARSLSVWMRRVLREGAFCSDRVGCGIPFLLNIVTPQEQLVLYCAQNLPPVDPSTGCVDPASVATEPQQRLIKHTLQSLSLLAPYPAVCGSLLPRAFGLLSASYNLQSAALRFIKTSKVRLMQSTGIRCQDVQSLLAYFASLSTPSTPSTHTEGVVRTVHTLTLLTALEFVSSLSSVSPSLVTECTHSPSVSLAALVEMGALHQDRMVRRMAAQAWVCHQLSCTTSAGAAIRETTETLVSTMRTLVQGRMEGDTGSAKRLEPHLMRRLDTLAWRTLILCRSPESVAEADLLHAVCALESGMLLCMGGEGVDMVPSPVSSLILDSLECLSMAVPESGYLAVQTLNRTLTTRMQFSVSTSTMAYSYVTNTQRERHAERERQRESVPVGADHWSMTPAVESETVVAPVPSPATMHDSGINAFYHDTDSEDSTSSEGDTPMGSSTKGVLRSAAVETVETVDDQTPVTAAYRVGEEFLVTTLLQTTVRLTIRYLAYATRTLSVSRESSASAHVSTVSKVLSELVHRATRGNGNDGGEFSRVVLSELVSEECLAGIPHLPLSCRMFVLHNILVYLHSCGPHTPCHTLSSGEEGKGVARYKVVQMVLVLARSLAAEYAHVVSQEEKAAIRTPPRSLLLLLSASLSHLDIAIGSDLRCKTAVLRLLLQFSVVYPTETADIVTPTYLAGVLSETLSLSLSQSAETCIDASGPLDPETVADVYLCTVLSNRACPEETPHHTLSLVSSSLLLPVLLSREADAYSPVIDALSASLHPRIQRSSPDLFAAVLAERDRVQASHVVNWLPNWPNVPGVAVDDEGYAVPTTLGLATQLLDLNAALAAVSPCVLSVAPTAGVDVCVDALLREEGGKDTPTLEGEVDSLSRALTRLSEAMLPQLQVADADTVNRLVAGLPTLPWVLSGLHYAAKVGLSMMQREWDAEQASLLSYAETKLDPEVKRPASHNAGAQLVRQVRQFKAGLPSALVGSVGLSVTLGKVRQLERQQKRVVRW